MMQVAKTERDAHVHLRIVERAPIGAKKPPWDWARWPVLASGVLAIAFFAASFFVPWWQFWLYAPQYPKGLSLVISLTGMGGDVAEIDILNHYIGMKHLAGAAPVERQLAGYGVAAVAVITLVLLAASGRKLNKLVAIPAIAFPIGFLADSFYWLYSFGHQLDPRAPLHIGAFTPQMFGNGQIGQFETFARPGLGFWLAIAGVGCAVLATLLRSRVCANCASAGTCKTVCPRLMVLPDPRGRS
jgi:hypothetical protein